MKSENKLSICSGYKLFSIVVLVALVIILAPDIINNYNKNLILFSQENVFSLIILLFFSITLLATYRIFILPNANKEEIKEKEISELFSLIRKDSFLNMISHEIRTPTQGIHAIAKGLVSNWNNFSNETNYELAVQIAHNAQRLFSVVDNVMDLYHIGEDKIKLKFQKANLISLIEEIIDECKTLHLNKKNITFNITSKIGKEVILLIDPYKIMHVLRNLLINSIKATKEGKITVEVNKNNNSIIVSVIDEGTGIPEENLKEIFSSIKENTTGTGLGLIVAREIMHAHGGEIIIENNSNKGVKVTLSLTIPSQKLEITTPKPVVISNTKHSNIIIIDDEETCHLSLKMMLHKTNYILHSFLSPIKALEFLESDPKIANMILLDVMMPELDGIEVLRKIKSHETLKNIPVIMQSGVADLKQIEESLNIGANDFLRKPYTKETLIAAIENILKAKS